MRRAGSREVVGSGCGSSRTCARPSREILPGRGFEQAALSAEGNTTRAILGVDGWAPYRCFKEATLQTCYNASAAPLPRATRDGHARGGALRTLGQGHTPARPRLARSARCWRDQPAWPASFPRDSSRRRSTACCTADSRISCQPEIRETSATLSGQPLCVRRACGRSRPPTIPPNKTSASPWSTARPAEAAAVPRKVAQAQSILMSVLQSCRH